jgi:uncharacterized protein
MPGSLPPLVAAAIREYRQRLTEQVGDRLLRVTVFGSVARGEARAESDVDVLVRIEAPTQAERRAAARVSWEVGYEHGLLLSPLVLSEAEWNELVARERLIASEIARDGVEG